MQTFIIRRLLIGVLIYFLRSDKVRTLEAVTFALIAAGGLGNIVDRVMAGKVVDFMFMNLDIFNQGWNWAKTGIFNVNVSSKSPTTARPELAAVDVVLSPKFQLREAMVPSVSLELSVKATDRPVATKLKSATGGILDGFITETAMVTVLESPWLSVTVSAT